MSETTITFHPLDSSDGPACLEVNRACPIEAELTLRFDRDPDFFAWPMRVFDSFNYLGIFAGNRLIGYVMTGFRTSWTGSEWGRWVYLGDFRIIPEFRGQHISARAFVEIVRRVPEDVKIGWFVITRGNKIARFFDRVNIPRISFHHAGVLDVVNLPMLRQPRFEGYCSVRVGVSNDYSAIAAFLRREWSGRLFSPCISEDRPAKDIEYALAQGRLLLAYRQGTLCGIAIWHDLGQVHRTTVIRYPARSYVIRACWAAARFFNRQIAALPGVDEAIRALVVTHLTADHNDPLVLRELLIGLLRLSTGQGVHLIQVAGFPGEGVLKAVKGMLQFHFYNDVWLTIRRIRPLEDNLSGLPPVIDLTMI